MRIIGILLLGLMGLCSGCKIGWCAMAVPKSMGKIDGTVKAIRTDAQGREVSRLELRYKDRTWQFIYSPEGPAERDYEIWRRLYEVTGKKAAQIPFQSTIGESDDDEVRYLIYNYFFPVGQERWFGMKYSGGEGGLDSIYDLSVMVFTKEKIISKFMIPAVAEWRKIGNYDFVNPWKLDEQNKQLLRIDTLTNGPVVFDLQKGEFTTGQDLVTKLPID